MQSRLRTLPTITLILVSFVLFGCEQTQVATPEPVTITIAGATSMRPVLQALSAEFSRRHPAVLFDLRGGGSTIGEEQLVAGQIDLAASTLTPSDPQNNQDITADQKIFRVPIGIDGLAIIVHRSNKVTALSLAQVRDLFSGKIVQWSAVGGDERDVLLVSREDGSGSRQLFESRLMGAEAVSLTAIVMPTSADVVDYVAKNPQAIAYVSRSYLVDQLDQVQPDVASSNNSLSNQVKVVALEGKLPTLENLKDSSYLLSAPIYLVGNGQPQGTIRQFIEFILGPVGQGIVGHYHARIR
ncbi:MAG: phosphate ABC transporter substrate-binding protein [Caldilineaceae bacterium]